MKIHRALLLLAAGIAAGLAIPVPRAQPASAPSLPANAKSNSGQQRSLRMSDAARREVRAIRAIKDRNARMQALVRLATSLPLGDIRQWYEGNYLGFLDEDSANVFRRIVEERWMEADPADIARFMMDRKAYRCERYIEAWLKADAPAAKAYLVTRKGEQLDDLTIDYAEIIGKTDVPAALEFLSSTKISNRFILQTALCRIARQDRDAVMTYLNGWPKEERSRVLKRIAEEYFETDLPWAIKLLQQQGETAESFARNMPRFFRTLHSGESRVGHFAGLPAGWAETIAASHPEALVNDCAADWLELREPPAWLSREAFEKLQLAAATDQDWEHERPGAGRRLVEEGDWLPVELRAKLAAILARTWKDGIESAEAWVATLDEDLRGETGKALDVLRQMSRGREQEWLAHGSPGLYLRALLDPAPAMSVHDVPESWDKGEIGEAIAASNSLSREDCVKLLGSRTTLPPELNAHLLQRSGDSLPPERSVKMHASIAAQWAEEDASAAARWVERLPEGEARTWAAKNVVLRWSSYSPAAAKAWEAKMAAKP